MRLIVPTVEKVTKCARKDIRPIYTRAPPKLGEWTRAARWEFQGDIIFSHHWQNVYALLDLPP